VTSVLQFIHGDAVKRVGTVVDDLIALLQGGRGLVDLSTSNQEELVTWSLAVHEVVLEGGWDLNGSLEDHFGRKLVFVDELGVTLENVEVTGRGCASAHLHFRLKATCAGWFLRDSLSPCGPSGYAFQLLDRIVSVRVSLACTTHLVDSKLCEKPMSLACVTVKSDRIIQ